MCGRYALALRPAQVRALLAERNMAADDAPDDDDVRQSYNFAPGYNGIVYRADVPDYGAGERRQEEHSSTSNVEVNAHNVNDSHDDVGKDSREDLNAGEHAKETHYKLQAMKWGLIPFWTKRRPEYGGLMKTINCRDDSLIENRGMWNTMKQRKRCIVVAQGFYEWEKRNGGRDKIPHFVKRKDGQLMCFAGLWDCVRYEGEEEKLYTYTIITTSSNKQLNFLHDRMPVILEAGSENLLTWLDPKRSTWSNELQSLLEPFSGELECYPVSKDVGKVGNNSPNFMVPLNSSQNKNNIANFFAKPAKSANSKDSSPQKGAARVKTEPSEASHFDDPRLTIDDAENTEDNAPMPVPASDKETPSSTPIKNERTSQSPRGQKRRHESNEGITASPKAESNMPKEGSPAGKAVKTEPMSSQDVVADVKASVEKMSSPTKALGRQPRSATSNGSVANAKNSKSPSKSKAAGNQRITNFFGK